MSEQKYPTDAENREALRQFLVNATGCAIQHTGWPCGTCVMSVLSGMGLDKEAPAYSQSNDEPCRHNEVWRAILQIREQHSVGDIPKHLRETAEEEE